MKWIFAAWAVVMWNGALQGAEVRGIWKLKSNQDLYECVNPAQINDTNAFLKIDSLTLTIVFVSDANRGVADRQFKGEWKRENDSTLVIGNGTYSVPGGKEMRMMINPPAVRIRVKAEEKTLTVSGSSLDPISAKVCSYQAVYRKVDPMADTVAFRLFRKRGREGG